MNQRSSTRWHCYDTADEVAVQVSRKILQAARESIELKGEFRLVLAGGTTPKRIYQLLAETTQDWSKWRLFIGDERCLTPEHPERNSKMVSENWLDAVNFPKKYFFPIHAEQGAEQGAIRYAELIKNWLPFDLVLLGMGEDGHTASLFPGHEHAENELVHAVHHAPKPPPDRVSLSLKALASTLNLYILVTGAGKQEAVREWRNGEVLPVSQITCANGVDVVCDKLAMDNDVHIQND